MFNTNSIRAALIVAAAVSITPRNITAQTVRDSAGIRIVMNTKPSWTPAQQLRLAETPTVVIGDRPEEPYQLSRVRGAVQLSDGRIVVADGGSTELRMFDTKGVFLKKIGRAGQGPGEFRDLDNIGLLTGDTIVVYDDRTVVLRFTADGKFVVRTDDRIPRSAGGPSALAAAVPLALDGGVRLVVARQGAPKFGPPGSRRLSLAEHTLRGADDKPVGQLGQLPVWELEAGINNASMPIKFTGLEVMATHGSAFYLGYGTSYSIKKYSARGEPKQIIRRSWTPVPVTPKDYKIFADEWLKRWAPTDPKGFEESKKDLMDDPYAKSLPAFSAIVLDNTGKLWVRAPKAIDAAVAGALNRYSIGPSVWSVFSTDGIWLGDVGMPARFMPMTIGADFVMGVARDEDDLPTVVRYKLGTK